MTIATSIKNQSDYKGRGPEIYWIPSTNWLLNINNNFKTLTN